jgi:hypothetical protein
MEMIIVFFPNIFPVTKRAIDSENQVHLAATRHVLHHTGNFDNRTLEHLETTSLFQLGTAQDFSLFKHNIEHGYTALCFVDEFVHGGFDKTSQFICNHDEK